MLLNNIGRRTSGTKKYYLNGRLRCASQHILKVRDAYMDAVWKMGQKVFNLSILVFGNRLLVT